MGSRKAYSEYMTSKLRPQNIVYGEQSKWQAVRTEEDVRQMPEDHQHLMGRGGARKGGLGRVVIVAKISEGMLFLKLKEEDASGKGLENHLKFY